MARDIGGMFERMTRRAPGGRRLDGDRRDRSGDRDDDDRYDGGRDDDRRHDRDHRDRAPEPASSRGGGLRDVLKDIVGRGRERARTTTERVRERTPTRTRPTATTRRDLPPEGTVVVEYSPDMHDGDPDPGEVVWSWVPFEEDPEQGKDRPVVVIGRRGRRLVGVPLTTKRNDREAQISIGTGGWDPKRRRSYARIWRLLDLEPDRMRREGAVLPQQKFEQVIAAVDEYYDVHRRSVTSSSPSRNGDDFDYDY